MKQKTTPEEAAAMVDVILNGPTIKRAPALFDLLSCVDGGRLSDEACAAMREAFLETPRFDKVLESCMAARTTIGS
jgi:hypothetical protein